MFIDLPSNGRRLPSGATLDLDFADGYAMVDGRASVDLADVVSFLGGDGRYALAADGIYRPVGLNQPRWDHDPLTGLRRVWRSKAFAVSTRRR